jgi:hypothetical protein
MSQATAAIAASGCPLQLTWIQELNARRCYFTRVITDVVTVVVIGAVMMPTLFKLIAPAVAVVQRRWVWLCWCHLTTRFCLLLVCFAAVCQAFAAVGGFSPLPLLVIACASVSTRATRQPSASPASQLRIAVTIARSSPTVLLLSLLLILALASLVDKPSCSAD